MKQTLSLWFCMCLALGLAQAQVNDSFADGNFTNDPIWSGDAADFTVVTEKLRSNSAVANANFALSTPSTLATSAQWDFTAELQFNTSSTNYVDIWLTASEADLKSTTNTGYFVRIGNTADEISLYKRVGGTNTIIINGTDAVTNFSSNNLRIFVTRDASNVWVLKHAPAGTSNFVTEGSTTDASITTSAFFGFSVKQSTATFFNKHFFDDITVSNLVIDNQAPTPLSVTVPTANSLRVVFDEAVADASAQNFINYSIGSGIGNPQTATKEVGNPAAVILTFAQNFPANTPLTLTVSNVADLSNNIMASGMNLDFTYFPPYVAQYRDIVINEIFADETPQVGLPLAEFVELYNKTNQSINLQGFKFAHSTTTLTLGNYTMQPNSFLILCATSQVANFQSYGNVLGVSLPALNNTGALLTLRDAAGAMLDAVDYKPSWYNDAVKANGGWTLEQINPTTLCTGASNWTASQNTLGGTPGTANAVLNTGPDITAPQLTSITVLSNTSIILNFNELMDTVSLNTGIYNISGGLSVASAKAGYPLYTSVLLTLNSPMIDGTPYTLSANNIKDCSGNLLPTTNTTFGKGAKPNYNDLVISEIFADETPQVGLPLGEFIEITNRSTKIIDVSRMLVADTSGGGRLPANTVLQPNERIIVTGTTAAPFYTTFGKTFGVTSFPSLANTGETLLLRNADGSLVYSVSYSDTWYQDDLKKQGGWTLEMIDVANPCGGASNWRASNNIAGGTPATVNSIAATNLDVTAPQVSNIISLSTTQLVVIFNEQIDSLQALSATYSINGGITVSNVLMKRFFYDRVYLTISGTLTEGVPYILTVSGTKDCAGNITTQSTGTFGKGAKPNYNDLVISEIFADETPQVGLPLGEFIEITNRSTKIIDVSGMLVADTSGGGRLPANTVLQPNERIIVTGTTAAPFYTTFGKTFGISNFPSLANTGETLLLRNADGSLVYSVSYSDTWYQDELKKQGGWTLEMIDVENPCGGASNWRASNNVAGGTPAAVNSIAASNPDIFAPQISNIISLSSTQLVVIFNEPIDSLQALSATYNINGGITVSNVLMKRFFYDRVYLTIGGTLTEGIPYILTVSGTKDCAGNITTQSTGTFGKGAKPNYSDLVISEIFADETPQVGLPLGEFIEITNRSTRIVDVSGMLVADTSSGGRLPANTVLQPNERIIVTGTTAAPFYTTFGKTFGVTSFPSLANTGETLLLRNADGSLVYSVSYSDTWYQDELKKQGGWTLEMIDVENPCGGASNWRASNNVAGGTPAAVNSIVASNPDIFAPQISNIISLSSTQLVVIFDEPIDSLQALAATYSINGGITVSNVLMKRFFYDRVYLTIGGTLTEGIPYILTVSGTKDCAGNITTQSTGTFGKGAKPNYNDLVISEIFADETPQVGLPLGEFIEITNRSTKIISVSGMLVADTSSGGRLPANTVLQPNERIIVTGTTAAPFYTPFGKTFGISNFPSLANTGETLLLRNADGSLVYSVSYSDTWYQDDLKKQGGWTLEMIDVANPCGGSNNWRASNDVAGGTPAAANSIAATNLDVTAPQISGVQSISNTEILVIFNEPIDSLQALPASYNISGGVAVNSVKIKRYFYDRVYLTLGTALLEGQQYSISISGVKDCAGNTTSGATANFGKGRRPNFHDLLITEIYADESPSYGLPAYEFLEIYNNTDVSIALGECWLSDATSRTRLPAIDLLPRQYIIVCSSTALPAYAALGKAISVSSFPTLNSSGDAMSIRRLDGSLVFNVNYLDTWYGSASKADGGWSLEMVDIQNPCGGANNWRASENPIGGTPGQVNSITASNPDLTAPQIVRADVLDEFTIRLQFNEPVDSTYTMSNSTNFQIDNGLTVTQRIIEPLIFDVVQLKLSQAMTFNAIYTLTISGLKDCAGNILSAGSITFVRPQPAEPSDVVLNEVLFNPLVGGVDFVEIYNNSNKFVDLKGWALANFSNSVVSSIRPITETFILKPAQYLAITTSKVLTKRDYPKVLDENMLEMPSLPSYNDGDGIVILLNPAGEIVQRLDYIDKMHFALLDDLNGVSLERISPDAPVNSPSSWQSASSQAGYGTPGQVNSQRINNLTSSGGLEIEPKAFTPDNDGDRDFTTIRYKFKSGNANMNINIYDEQGRLVRRLVQNQVLGSDGFYIWDGTTDEGRKARIGLYVIYFERLEMGGKKETYKESVAVGAKF